MLNTFVKKYPALVSALPLAAGIAVSYYSGLNLTLLPLWFFMPALSLLAVVIIYVYKTISRGELFLFTYFALIILYGIFSFQYAYYKTGDRDISKLTGSYGEKKAVLKGTLTERPEVKENRVRLVMESQTVDDKPCDGTVIVTVYKNTYENRPGVDLKYGDVISVEGKLESLPHRRNPGEFDYGEYLKLHGISAVFTASGYKTLEVTGYEKPSFYKANVIIPVKEYSAGVIDELIGGEEGEYLKGLVLGERSNISREMRENFVNAGVAHIIAVSGLNVAYVIIIVWGILLFIPIRHSYKAVITIIILFFYMNLTGNTPSIIRAVIMASIFLVSQVIERKPNPYNIVSAASLVILLIDPRQLFDAGFILSFSAILSIIIIYPRLEKLLENFKWYRRLNNDDSRGKALKWTIALFLGTLAAQLGTLPITAIMFKKVSVISLIANLFAIPLSNIALALGFVMIILSTVSVWAASVFASLNSLLLYFQLLLIELCAKLDYAYVETYFADRMLLVFYYVSLALAFTINKSNYKARLAIIALLILNFFVWKAISDKTGKAEITYIDVGNSNSTLITMPGGTSVLINTGSSSVNYTSAERNILPYLKMQRVNELDLLIINSLNFNEFRSLRYLAENFPVKKVVLPVYYKPLFRGETADIFNNSRVEFIEGSRVVNRQGNFRIYLYYDSLYKGGAMLTELVYGRQNFVFSDSYSIDDDYRNTALFPEDAEVKILKVPASGSFDYTSTEFLVKSNPEIVVISQSKSPRKKLNSSVFRSVLSDFGIDVMNTSESGALIFETDGYTTEAVKWR